MATLLNSRNSLLAAAATRILGASVYITSGAATGFTIPANGTTALPGTINLTAVPSRYTVPSYTWGRRFGDSGSFETVGTDSPNLTVLGDADFVTLAGTNSIVQYKVDVVETGGPSANPSSAILTLPILRQGSSSILGVLTNESQSVYADNTGTIPVGTTIQSTLYIYSGTTDDSANWSVSIVASSGITATLINGKTISITAIDTLNGYVDITATRQGYPDILKRFTVNKVLAGADGTVGEDGQSPTVYELQLSAPVVKRSASNSVTPSSLAISAFTITGIVKTAYSGRFKVYADGSLVYTSSINQSAHTYTLPTDKSLIKVELYQAGGTTTLLDSQEVPVVVDGSSGITISVSNTAFVAPADSTGAVSTYAGSGTTIQVFEGSTALTYRTTLGTNVSSFAIGTPTLSVANAITVGTRSGNGTTTATVANHSAMSTSVNAVVITYPITYNRANGAQATQSVTQTITKALAGSIGVRGSRQVYATDAAYTSTYDFDGAGATASGAASYAAKATQLIATVTAGLNPTTPINGDTVTFSNGTNYVYTITHNGTGWVPPGTIIDGSLLVTGSVTASKINSNGLEVRAANGDLVLGSNGLQSYSLINGTKPPVDATKGATIGTDLNGQITSGNASTYIAAAAIGAAQIGSISLVGTGNFAVKSADTGQRMEMDSRFIKVYDSSGVLRIHFGDLTL